MRYKILIFLLMFALALACTVIVASAVTLNEPLCNHNDYDFVDGKCEDYIVNGNVVCHSQRVQCNVCDLMWSVGVSCEINDVSTFDNMHTFDLECIPCGEEWSYSESCNIVDGVCSVCGAVGHVHDYDFENPFYEYVDNRHHNVLYPCSCGENFISKVLHNFVNGICDKCGFTCGHTSWENGVCTICKTICGHTYTSTYEYYSDTQHKVNFVCTKCNYKTSSYDAHSYNACRCACGDVSHNGKIDFVLKSGSVENHIFNMVCGGCDTVIDERVVEHSSIEYDYHYTYTQLSDMAHNVNKICDDCNTIVESSPAAHTLKNGKCTVCDFSCQHIAHSEDGICINCGFITGHNIKHRISDSARGKLDEYYCTICSKLFAQFNSLDADEDINFHKRPLFANAWNNILSSVQFTENIDGEIVGVYQRFTNEDYAYNTQSTITLVGGYQYNVDVGNVKNSRYAVLRLRYVDVKYLELDLWTGDNYVNPLPSNMMSGFANIKLSAVPENEWVNLVIDLSKFSPRNKVYDITSTDDYNYMRALLCATFTSSDGYIDIDYFALCNDKAEIDKCLSYSYGDNYNSYYSYSGSTFSKVNSSHNFMAGDTLKRDCVYCGFRCPHNDYTIKYHTSSTLHSVYKKCNFCPWDYDWVREPHYFTDNTVKCTDEHCTFECNHLFVKGFCQYCNWNCDHLFLNGRIRCSSCGHYARVPVEQSDDGLFNLIYGIYDGQVSIFFSLLDYQVFGINIASLLISIAALAIVAFVLKKVL